MQGVKKERFSNLLKIIKHKKLILYQKLTRDNVLRNNENLSLLPAQKDRIKAKNAEISYSK